ncbi:MAG TPA: TetR/AcrR family transcriptional regulator [Spongiibacteraceae bacterium]|nr:TetR/AcrR family transcriptional regulator [Spongiibacteraceae bacterium]
MNTAQNLSQGARAILQAAAELFALESFASVSVGAIAERAGVSKSNVFHHFVSKEELFLAVMREAGMSHAEFAEQLLAEPGPSLPKLRRLIDFEIADFFANPQKIQLVLRALSNHSCGNGHRLAARTFNRNFRAVVALLAQGQARGELRSDFDPETAAMIIGGANEMILRMHEYVNQNSTVSQRKTLQTYIDSVFDILLRGVATSTCAIDSTDAIDSPGASAGQTTRVTAVNAPAMLRKSGARPRPKETQCR